MKKINLKEKFDLFDEKWTPKIVGQLNGQAVKIAKVEGDFVWHNHEHEDELFYVLKGQLIMHFEEGAEVINAGEMIIVPKGVEHKPEAAEETWIMLFEPMDILHTGKVKSHLTKNEIDWI